MDNDSIEIAQKESGTLELIAKHDGAEFMLQHAVAGSLLEFEPGDEFEFYFVVKGRLLSKGGDLLKPGTYFDSTTIGNQVLTAETDVTLLYYSHQPVFGLLSKEIFTMNNLATSVETKDGNTKDHCQRIQNLAKKIAQELDLSNRTISRLMPAAFLHDLGKLDVPEIILGKQGPLTDEEWRLMKLHPIYGADRLKGSHMDHIAPIIEQHHERPDGKGYPNGLRDDEILVEAAIISVADAYDAMTNDRTYRKALPIEEAIKRLREGEGTQFRSRMVRALERIIGS